ncbi:hypothetical protein N9942_00090 [Akkermansiaceae bacterium]|nr:hypothetical protein [Akkermansiaceae bacterium]MDA8980666.1 hypothetical protein [bacterium]MDB4322365.1 hypothetical protein [Akkermansiaceae bacterium]MDB4382015.1 hypothetical protein [Akkermansiaceae bacterium]
MPTLTESGAWLTGQAGNHAGLGLSFSREVIGVLGGTIEVSQVTSDRIAFVVTLTA